MESHLGHSLGHSYFMYTQIFLDCLCCWSLRYSYFHNAIWTIASISQLYCGAIWFSSLLVQMAQVLESTYRQLNPEIHISGRLKYSSQRKKCQIVSNDECILWSSESSKLLNNIRGMKECRALPKRSATLKWKCHRSSRCGLTCFVWSRKIPLVENIFYFIQRESIAWSY